MHLPLAHEPSLVHGSPSLSRQLPAPLQTIVPLQAGAMSVWPSGISEQVPMVARLQAWHSPVHAVSQQTPSAQKLLLQSMAAAHVSPLHFVGHEPPQSIPVSSPFIVPSLHETHCSCTQRGFVPVLQSPSATHSTHMAMLLQTPPLQPEPTGSFVVIGTPLLQLSVVHMLPSTGGVSLSSLMVVVPPMPSHASVLQSPFVGSLMGIPSGRKASVHMPMVQDQLMHGVSFGQSPLFMHGPPLELLELLELLDEAAEEDDEEEDDDDEPPAPAVPLDELELFSAPALPPVAVFGSN